VRIRAVSALAVFALLALGGMALLTAQQFDLAIVNGRVIDPESGLDAVRSVGISGSKIAAISADRLNGRTVVDATGLVVGPGFIDLHAHGQTPDTYRLEARDGVTTALELEVGTGDVEGWYAEREAGRLINYGVSIGHIPVRMRVLRDPGTFLPTGSGAHGAASPADVKEMVRRLEDGLKQGAVSLGAGFVYTPAATRDELLEVFHIAARTRVPIHTHVRSGLTGVEDAVGLATTTNAPLHIVHLNSTCAAAIRECLQKISEARGRGLDVTTEAYPYTAGMTEIQSANLDSYEKGPDERLADLEWPRTGERLTRETFRRYRQMGGPVITHSNTEEMVAVAINSPLTMIASDAYWVDGTGHPRTSGTYSKILGRFAREAHSLTLIDALRKMTLMPAQRLEARVPGMRDKGRVRVGADADLTIFDAARVLDRSTYREPALPPDGIRHVIVNGVTVVSNGKLVPDVSPGKAIRAPTPGPRSLQK